MHDPREAHLTAMKRTIQRIRGTLDYGLQLHPSSPTELIVYSTLTGQDAPRHAAPPLAM